MIDSGMRHTFWAGPWHHCGVCDRKVKISTMKWQRGVLKCTQASGHGHGCFDDPPLLGQREMAIAAILEDGKQELVPVDKLRNPTLHEESEDFIL